MFVARSYRGPDRRGSVPTISRTPWLLLWWLPVLVAMAVPAMLIGDALAGRTAIATTTMSGVQAAMGAVLAGVAVLLQRATGEARATRLATAAALLGIAGGWHLLGAPSLAAAATGLAGWQAVKVRSAPQVDTSLRHHREMGWAVVAMTVAACAVLGLSRVVPTATVELAATGAALTLWSASGLGLARAWHRRQASALQAWASGLAVAVVAAQATRLLAATSTTPALGLSASAITLIGLMSTAIGGVHLLTGTLEDRRSELHALRVTQARQERGREEEHREFVHEARNALMGIEAATSALRNAPVLPDGLRDELTDALTNGVARLRRLVLPEDRVSTSGPTPVGDVVVPTVLLARTRGTQILLDGDLHTAVNCSPGALAQALDNLLLNAHRHGNAARVPAVVDVRDDGIRLQIRVSDRGPGVPAVHHERVFEPGLRLADTGGDGIGLAVSRDLLRSCGGDLRLEPSEVGATFVATLPIASATVADRSAAEDRHDQLV